MSDTLLKLAPSAQTVIALVAAFFAWRGWVRGWDRERRLLVWLLIGLAVVNLGGAFLIRRLNGFYVAFRILAQAGFDVQAAFKVAAEQFAKIPPLIPKERETLALVLIFLAFAWWGNRPPRRPKKTKSESLVEMAKEVLQTTVTSPITGIGKLLGLPGEVLKKLPGVVLGGVNGFIIAYYVVPRVFSLDTTPVEKTIVTVPIAPALELLKQNVVNVVVAVIVVALLRLFQTGARAGSKGK
jgi:hypothetical protein